MKRLIEVLGFLMRNCEIIASLLWFAMDFFWMSEHLAIAKVISVFAIIFALFNLLVELEAEGRKLTNMVAVAGFMWLLMNVAWMLESKTFSMLFGCIGVSLIILSLHAAKGFRLFIYRTFGRFRRR